MDDFSGVTRTKTSTLYIMNHTTVFFLLISLVMTFSQADAKNFKESTLPENPNIVFIMMDDFDIFDMAKFKELYQKLDNSEHNINTPNLDAFFDRSLKFSNYHTNGANCSPTRGSLLTGLYPSDLGFYRAVSKNSERGIPARSKLISEVLQSSGYTTATVGKWNVGHKGDSLYNPNLFKAFERGFDYSFCSVGCYIDSDSLSESNKTRHKTQSWQGYGGSYSRFQLEHQNRLQTELTYTSIGAPGSKSVDLENSQYITKVNTDKAINFIKRQKSAENKKPFFLNLWYWLPHGPVHVPMGITEKNKLKTPYLDYYMRSNFPIPKGMESGSEQHKIDQKNCKDNTTKKNSKTHNFKCNTRLGEYAAMITRLDAAIGRIIEATQHLPNTLIIITSDNGGAAPDHVLRDSVETNTESDKSKNFGTDPKLVFRGSKNELYERGIRVPLMIRWLGENNEDLLSNDTIDDLILSREFYPTLSFSAGLMLSNSHAYGENFFDRLIKKQSTHRYYNNQRKEWLTSQQKPVFYENNAGNQPRLIAVNSRKYPNCQPINTEKEGINYAIQNNLWKYIYTTSQWDNIKFKKCLPEKSELYSTLPNSKGQYETINVANSYNHVVNYLKLLRLRWQSSVGRITLKPEKINTAQPEMNLTYVPNLGQLNISDGHFTFATNVKTSVCNYDDEIVVAEKPGSWKLYIKNNHLALTINIAEAGDSSKLVTTMMLSSGNLSLDCKANNFVGFTVLGGRTSGPLVKLFINGKLTDSLVTTTKSKNNTTLSNEGIQLKPIKIKTPYIVTEQSDLIIGNKHKPELIDSISSPVAYVNPLSESEMTLLAKNKLFSHQFQQTNLLKTISKSQLVQFSNSKINFNDFSNNNGYISLLSDSYWGDSTLFGFSTDIKKNTHSKYNHPMVVAQHKNKDSLWLLSVTHKTPQKIEVHLKFYTETLNTFPGKICEPLLLTATADIDKENQKQNIGFMKRNNTLSLFINDMPYSKTQIPSHCSFNNGKQINIGRHSIQAFKNQIFKFNGSISNIQILPKTSYSVKKENINTEGQILSFKDGNKGVVLSLKEKNYFLESLATKPLIFTSTINILNTSNLEKPIHIAKQVGIEKTGWQLSAIPTRSKTDSLFNLKLSILDKSHQCNQTMTFKGLNIASFEEHHLGLAFEQPQIHAYLDGKKVQSLSINPECYPQNLHSDIFLGSSTLENQFNGYMYTPKIWKENVSEDAIKWAAIFLDKYEYF